MIIGMSKPIKFKFASYTIQKLDGVEFSHTFCMFFSESLNRWLVYHATSDGVYFVGLEEFLKHNEIIKQKEVILTETERIMALRFCIDNSGKPYGYTQLLGIGVIKIAAKINIQIVENPFADGSTTFVCTETMLRMLVLIGKTKATNFDTISLKQLDHIIFHEMKAR